MTNALEIWATLYGTQAEEPLTGTDEIRLDSNFRVAIQRGRLELRVSWFASGKEAAAEANGAYSGLVFSSNRGYRFHALEKALIVRPSCLCLWMFSFSEVRIDEHNVFHLWLVTNKSARTGFLVMKMWFGWRGLPEKAHLFSFFILQLQMTDCRVKCIFLFLHLSFYLAFKQGLHMTPLSVYREEVT